MNIDRKSFLLLTAALAAGAGAVVAACSVTSTTVVSGTDGGVTNGDATGGADSAPAIDSSGTADAGNDSPAPCNDTTTDGSVPSCTTGVGPDAGLDGGCGADPRANGFCAAINANLKPLEGQLAINCFVPGPACEGVTACIGAGLLAACPDPTATTYCQGIVAACVDAGAIDGGASADAGDLVASCAGVAAGLTATGRSAFQSCFVGTVACTDLQTCIAALAQ
jgi:hypothetical protein